MPPVGLSTLQRQVVLALAGLEPQWALPGGAALVGVHGVRRVTRKVDLCFHGLSELGELCDEVSRRLTARGFELVSLQASRASCRYGVSRAGESVVLDLIAESVPVVEPPVRVDWGGAQILVDTPHEILVNKLGALLHRSELRDLSDVCDLLEAGGDLERALRDAPRKEAGFSALTLAWLLNGLALASLT